MCIYLRFLLAHTHIQDNGSALFRDKRNARILFIRRGASECILDDIKGLKWRTSVRAFKILETIVPFGRQGGGSGVVRRVSKILSDNITIQHSPRRTSHGDCDVDSIEIAFNHDDSSSLQKNRNEYEMRLAPLFAPFPAPSFDSLPKRAEFVFMRLLVAIYLSFSALIWHHKNQRPLEW